jgi:hypothetical protein
MLAATLNQIPDVSFDFREIPAAGLGNLMKARGVDVETLDFDAKLVFGQRKRRVELFRLLRQNSFRCENSLES